MRVQTNFVVPGQNYSVDYHNQIIFVYLSSLPVASLSDAPRRRLVVTGDSARIQDETTESSAWFFKRSVYSTVGVGETGACPAPFYKMFIFRQTITARVLKTK